MEVRIPTLTASQEVMLTALALTWKSTTCWRRKRRLSVSLEDPGRHNGDEGEKNNKQTH